MTRDLNGPGPAADLDGGGAAVQALRDEGVNALFGIPGTHNLPIYRHLTGSGIRHITPRHEQGAGYAADGYARVSGHAGVVHATTGPGILNAATSAATAWADSVPMLLLSPALPTAAEGLDGGFLHETKNQQAAMDAVCAYSVRARTPQQVYDEVRRAFTVFATARPRPVHIDLPLDVLAARGPVQCRASAVTGQPDGLDPDAVGQVITRLTTPGTTVGIVAGGGARNAARQVTELAERINAPVLTTVNGKGVINERHRLSLGAHLRLPGAQQWLASLDTVVAIGTELGESDLWNTPPSLRSLVRIDIDNGQLDKNIPATHRLLGDAVHTLTALTAALPEQPCRPAPDIASLRQALRDQALVEGGAYAPVCQGLQDALGTDGLLAADSTMASYYGIVHLLKLDRPGRLLYPTGYATLGYALPAAIGAAVARPDAPVIALCGDGGLMFSVAELATAVENHLPIAIVVINNHGYGEIKRQMLAEGIDPVGVDLHVPDLTGLAAAFGAASATLASPDTLAAEIDRAWQRDRPTLIELPVPAAGQPRRQHSPAASGTAATFDGEHS